MRRRLLVGALLVAGCVSAVPEPTAADAARAQTLEPSATLADLAQGRKAYVARCAGCHQLYPPAERSPEAWPAIVSGMAARAKVTDTDRDAIKLYLTTMSRR